MVSMNPPSSDGGLSDAPSKSESQHDTSLEQALRDEVAKVFKSGKMEELTVKRVRRAVEQNIGLAEGYFKSTEEWKARSEHIIKDAVERQEEAQAESPEKSSPQPQPKKKAPPKRPKSDAAPKSRKRQKTQTPDSEPELSEASSEGSDDETTKPKESTATKAKGTKAKAPKKPADEPDSVDEDVDMENTPADPTTEAAKEDSDSEMSVVLDEEPKPTPKKRKSADGPAKKGKKPAPKAAPKAKEEEDPDQAEIKRLQGWLVKCGIRKMWFRELAPYDTPKAKIKHLKGMLEEAGMTGRYSQEKANKIRDERELKADLEQIQQGAQHWGEDGGSRRRGARGGKPAPKIPDDEDEDDDEDSDEDVAQKRVPRGRQSLAFLDDEDGEESD